VSSDPPQPDTDHSPNTLTTAPGRITVLDRVRALGAGVSQLYIDGQWCEPTSDAAWQHVHPASGEEDFTIPVASDEDVDRAVRAARRAFDEGPWPRMHARERKLLLRPLGELIRGHEQELAELQSLDNGLPISVGSAFRFSGSFSADLFEYFAGWTDKLDGGAPPVYSEHAAAQMLTIKEPVGVVAAITPFNAPVMQFAQKVAPALAAGCTIVLKPSEYATNVSALYARLIEQLDLPPGVFNLIPGPASSSTALVRHPLIDKVAFTGRRAVGEQILTAAVPGLKHVQLELGGKSPGLVFDDIADVATTARYVMAAVSMGLSGQICGTQTRALVHKPIYDEFVSAAAGQLGDVRYGDSFDPATTSAPLITEAATERVLGLMESAVDDGARLVSGGGRVDDLGTGNWVQPTLFAEVDNTTEIAQEEIFGPVLCVIPFDDEEDAIRIANDSVYGLSAGVYTGNPSRAIRVARALRTGSVGINGLFVSPPPVPFGGYKTSGLGREGGREGIEGYLETKTISIPLEG